MQVSGGMNNFLLQRGRKLVAGIHCALRQTSVMIATTSVTFGLDCRLLVCLGLTLEAGPLLTLIDWHKLNLQSEPDSLGRPQASPVPAGVTHTGKQPAGPG